MVNMNGFDPDEHDDMKDFSPVPNGIYSVMITETEVNPNSKETGHYLTVKMQIVDHPELNGRLLFTFLNLDNPTPRTVAIAKEELATICRAAGIVGKLEDTEQLHNKVVEVTVVVEKRNDDETKFVSKIKFYKKVGTAASQAAEGKTVEAVGAATTNPAPADTPADSWMRKT